MDTGDDEQVLFRGHPSWRSILGYYLKGLLATVVAGLLVGGASRVAEGEVKPVWVGAAVGAVLAIVLVVGLVKRIATTYTITDRRLHIRRGIVARRVQETRLDRVQNVNTNQSVLERLLQIGTVDFDTAGGDDFEFAFKGVAEPGDVVAAVDRAQRNGTTAA